MRRDWWVGEWWGGVLEGKLGVVYGFVGDVEFGWKFNNSIFMRMITHIFILEKKFFMNFLRCGKSNGGKFWSETKF